MPLVSEQEQEEQQQQQQQRQEGDVNAVGSASGTVGWLTRASVSALGVQTLATLKFYEDNHLLVDPDTIVGVLDSISRSIFVPSLPKFSLPKGPKRRERMAHPPTDQETATKVAVTAAVRESVDVTRARERRQLVLANPVFLEIVDHAALVVRALCPRDLATLCRLLNTLQIRHPHLEQRLLEVLPDNLRHFNGIDLAMSFHALTLIYGKDMDPRLLTALVSQGEATIPKFSPQDLSLYVWCLKVYAINGSELGPTLVGEKTRLEAAETRALEALSTFRAQEISTLLHAFATLHYDCNRLLEAFPLKWKPRLHEFGAQGLSNVAWAYARLDADGAEPLFEGLARECQSQGDSLIPQHISNILWAAGKLELKGDAIVKALRPLFLAKASQFTPQGIANVAWGLARVGGLDKELAHTVRRESKKKLKEFPPQELSTLLWALAKAESNIPSAFLAAICEAARNMTSSFSLQNIATFLNALSKLGVKEDELFTTFGLRVVEDIPKFARADLEHLNWSYHQLSNPPHNVLDAISGALMKASLQSGSTAGAPLKVEPQSQ